MKRIITALVLLPIVVWVVLAGPSWSLLLLMAAVGLIAFHEFDTIAGAQGVAIRMARSRGGTDLSVHARACLGHARDRSGVHGDRDAPADLSK
jgi:hypothetical protein